MSHPGVVAKFYVRKVTPTPEGSSTAAQIEMGAVCRGIENAVWSQATPGGSISMNVLNAAATPYFEEGAEYLVTFERVAKPEPHDGHKLIVVQDKHGAFLCETCGFFPIWPDGFKQGVADWSKHDEIYGPS